MAIGNGFTPTYGFKVDPDGRQDRRSSEATTRKMTPEEIEEYGKLSPIENKQSTIAAVPGMVRKGIEMTMINKERLIEICAEQGFTAEAYRIAAKEFDVSPSSVANYISNNKLKKMVTVNKKQSSEEPTSQGKSCEESEQTKTLSELNEELEIISKIKSILQENKSLSGENSTLKENMSKVKAALEDILKLIA